MGSKIRLVALGAILGAGVAGAQAQTAPSRETAPSTVQGGGSNLSNKLGASDGVIKPTNDVDPGMHAPTPNAPNTMPVIPPAATGGENAK